MAERTDHDPNGAAWAPDSGLKNTTQWISPLPAPDSIPNPLPPVQSGFSRRRFLGATAVALGVAAVGGVSFAAGKFGISPKSETDPYVPERTYQSGDTIKTPAGNVVVSGWRFDIDPREYERFYRDSENIPFFSYGLHMPHNQSATNKAILTYERGEQFSPMFQKSTIDGRPLQSARIFPYGDGFPLVESKPDVKQRNTAEMTFVAKRENGDIAHSRAYSIELKYFTAPDTKDQRPAAYFEEKLEEGVRQDIESFAQAFNPFTVGMPRTFIYDGKNGPPDRGGYEYTKLGERVALPSIVFTDPESPQEGYVQLCQFLAHEVIASKNRLVSDDPFETAFQKALQHRRSEALYGTPYQNIFDVHHHKGAHPLDIHTAIRPFSDQESLFVSALTTLKMFPKRFLIEYQELSPEDAREVQQVLKGVERTLNEARPLQDLISIKHLIPDWDHISATVGI